MIGQLFRSKPYSGGPHFDRPRVLSFDLDGVTFECTQPGSDCVWENAPRALNVPFSRPGWFEQNCESGKVSPSVHLHTEIWYYFPVGFARVVNMFAMGANQPSAELTVSLRLRRLMGAQTLDLNDPRSLSNYIQWSYLNHYDSPEKGPYGKGQNFEVRSRFGEILKQKGPTYKGQYDAAMRQYLAPIPTEFEYIVTGNATFALYTLCRTQILPIRHYCVALSESYYLDIEMEPNMRYEHRAKLEPDMLRTMQWIFEHVRLTFPEKRAALPQGAP